MSKVALIFLECLYPITVNTYYAVKAVDRKLVWSALNMGASPAQVFRNVMLPAAAWCAEGGGEVRRAEPLAALAVGAHRGTPQQLFARRADAGDADVVHVAVFGADQPRSLERVHAPQCLRTPQLNRLIVDP